MKDPGMAEIEANERDSLTPDRRGGPVSSAIAKRNVEGTGRVFVERQGPGKRPGDWDAAHPVSRIVAKQYKRRKEGQDLEVLRRDPQSFRKILKGEPTELDSKITAFKLAEAERLARVKTQVVREELGIAASGGGEEPRIIRRAVVEEEERNRRTYEVKGLYIATEETIDWKPAGRELEAKLDEKPQPGWVMEFEWPEEGKPEGVVNFMVVSSPSNLKAGNKVHVYELDSDGYDGYKARMREKRKTITVVHVPLPLGGD